MSFFLRSSEPLRFRVIERFRNAGIKNSGAQGSRATRMAFFCVGSEPLWFRVFEWRENA